MGLSIKDLVVGNWLIYKYLHTNTKNIVTRSEQKDNKGIRNKN